MSKIALANSLGDLIEKLKANNIEILSFNGYEIESSIGVISLSFGELKLDRKPWLKEDYKKVIKK